MPMSPRLLRPRASGVHPEAAAWRSAVVANGGSVSASTMNAVSTFCGAIDKANLRDRFHRLNLFCGTGLSAALVPLYRGPSASGTQYGDAADTNTNFVSGDYVETGATGGLQGLAASAKRLSTTIPLNFSTATNLHAGVYDIAPPATGSDRTLIGGDNAVLPRVFWAVSQSTPTLMQWYDGTDAGGIDYAVARTPGFYIGSNQSGRRDLFRNGSSVASIASAKTGVASRTTPAWHVFTSPTDSGTFGGNYSGRLGAYTLGYSLTAAQASSFYTIMQNFQTALGRQV